MVANLQLAVHFAFIRRKLHCVIVVGKSDTDGIGFAIFKCPFPIGNTQQLIGVAIAETKCLHSLYGAELPATRADPSEAV